MKPSIEAFSDELIKIAEESQSAFSKTRAKAALRAIGPAAIMFGLGSGLGAMAGRSLGKHVTPKLSQEQMTGVGAVLGAATGLSMMAMQHYYKKYIDEAEAKKKKAPQ